MSLDAENGRLKSRGWVEDTGLMIDSVVSEAKDNGASFIVFTDISKDGMQTGINPEPVKKTLETYLSACNLCRRGTGYK